MSLRERARDLRSAPNLVSLSRIVLVSAGATLWILGAPLVGLALGTAGGLSDYLDGWLARRLGQETELGAILDRLSDLVFETLGFLVATHEGFLSPLFLLAYLLREFVVLSARLYCAEKGVPIASSFLGKLKTNVLGYSFLLIYLHLSGIIPAGTVRTALEGVSMGAVVAGLGLAWISGGQYVRRFVRAYEGR